MKLLLAVQDRPALAPQLLDRQTGRAALAERAPVRHHERERRRHRRVVAVVDRVVVQQRLREHPHRAPLDADPLRAGLPCP